MSSCDGSGYMIGCPGCPECREEMEAIRATMRNASEVLAGLTARYQSAPWSRNEPQGEVEKR